MQKKLLLSLLAALGTLIGAATASVHAQVGSMTFFVSSVGKGNGDRLHADELASISEHDDARR
jgi:hypothetical protein